MRPRLTCSCCGLPVRSIRGGERDDVFAVEEEGAADAWEFFCRR